jgi:hypothetical protein
MDHFAGGGSFASNAPTRQILLSQPQWRRNRSRLGQELLDMMQVQGEPQILSVEH